MSASTELEPFLSEHAYLSAGLERIRRTAEALPSLSIERRRRRIESVLVFLSGPLARHAKAEELELYPVIARRLRYPAAAAPMIFDHELVRESARALGQANPRDVARLQQLLYGLHALLDAHFRKEERFYLPLLAGPDEVDRVFRAMEEVEYPSPDEEEDVRQVEYGPHGFPLNGTDAEKLAWAVGYAVQAPSSHNSQPWRFHVYGNVLELRADRTRALPVVDPHDRELTMSCGAALFHLRVALRKVGETASVDALPDPGAPDVLARIRLGAVREPSLEEKWLFWAIRTRRTNRRRYDDKPVPEELLAELERAAAAEGARLVVLRSDEKRTQLATLVARADRLQASDRSFRRELASWLHPNRTQARDGMPGWALGMSDVVSSVGPLVVRTFDWGRGRAARDEQLALGSPVLAVLTTEGDRAADWLAAGQALARVLLRAASEDVVASFLNQPVEVDELRADVVALTGGGTPQLVLRMGFAKGVAATPRRPVDEVLS